MVSNSKPVFPSQQLQSDQSPFEAYRDYYYSIHEADRSEAIEFLATLGEPEAARELIHIFHECEWRTTRFQVIQALGRLPTERTLEFLFRIARDTGDLPMAEAAIRSCGQSQNRLAAGFLKNYWRNAPSTLRAAIVGALGQIPDRSLSDEFLAELPQAIKAQQVDLVRNLVFSLGELRVFKSLSPLIELAATTPISSLALCALVAIGKLASDPSVLKDLSKRFSNDVLDLQIFRSVHDQITLRSQFTLDQAIQRIVTAESFHPVNAYELHQFDALQVREKLKQLAQSSSPDQRKKVALTLEELNFPAFQSGSEEFGVSIKEGDKTQDSEDQRGENHSSDQTEELGSLFWTDAIQGQTLSLSAGIAPFKTVVEQGQYRALSIEERGKLIHSLYLYGLSVQSDSQFQSEMNPILEQLFGQEESDLLQARMIRALAVLGLRSKKINSFIGHLLEDVQKANSLASLDKGNLGNLLKSALQFLECNPEPGFLKSLIPFGVDLLSFKKWDEATQVGLEIAYFKALCSYPQMSQTQCLTLLPFVKTRLEKKETHRELILCLLKWIRSVPHPSLLQPVLSCLGQGFRLQLAAIITLKSFASEQAVEPVASFLTSPSASLAGRALDTLSSLPGIRAKRILIDHLADQIQDLEVCAKVIRSFRLPESGSEYFIQLLDTVLKANPDHPLIDGLIQMREKLMENPADPSVLNLRKPFGLIQMTADVALLDQELRKKITHYDSYDESIKSVLRSAELPYLHREIFDQYVDKGSSVVEYCKAVDLFLEKTLGKRRLFPKLEHSLVEFQNVIHAYGLHSEDPGARYVLKTMDLEKFFDPSSFPLHKMLGIAQAIGSGRVLNDHFKVIDGLRAWAVVVLLFCRGPHRSKPLIPMKNLKDEQLISIAKRMIKLQDIRNPIAHRQTVIDFSTLDEVRAQAFSILNFFDALE
ncbi:MAG: HEAT repeat domain-containing protein [Bdellovibrionia bacterium]